MPAHIKDIVSWGNATLVKICTSNVYHMLNEAYLSGEYGYLRGDGLSIIALFIPLERLSLWKIITDANLFCCGG